MSILDEILETKRLELAEARRRRSPESLRAAAEQATAPTRGFRGALAEAPGPAVIAEIKRRSPSKGLIRVDFDPASLARNYERGGAAALSVLTDEKYFGGSLAFLEAAREVVALPLLRKEFVIDGYQIDEARVAGADAVLLICAALSAGQLSELRAHALARGLDTLVEVHDEDELEMALGAGADLIGVNNRNLRTFVTDLAVTERLAARLPQDRDILLVAESGINAHADVARLQKVGARAFLVGESLMRQNDVCEALETLRRSS